MKRLIQAMAAMLVLAMALFMPTGCTGCGNDDLEVQLPAPETQPTTTTTEAPTEPECSYDCECGYPEYCEYECRCFDANMNENDANSNDTTVSTDATTTTAPGATSPATTTTTRPGQTTAATTTTTTRPGQTTTTTRPPTTTTRPPTTAGTTAPPPGGTAQQVLTTPITIANNQQALDRFNATVARMVSQQAGFSKNHRADNFVFTPGADIADVNIPLVNNFANVFESFLRTLITRAPSVAQQEPGRPSTLIQNSRLTMGDVGRGVSFRQLSNGNWEITLNVNNGNTTWRGSQTGSAPMQRGPINRVTDMAVPGVSAALYDHACASRINNMMRGSIDAGGSSPIPGLVTPVEIQETTTNARYVMTLDRNGNPINIVASFSQAINLTEATVLTQTITNNRMSSTVTITYYNIRFPG